MFQVAFEVEETDSASTQPSTAIIHINLRLKLPAFLSGASTPWITGLRMKLNGEMSPSTVIEDITYYCTVLVNASTFDPHGSSSLVPFSVSLLKFKSVGDTARGRRLELVGRTTATIASKRMSASALIFPGAARTASITGAPDSLMKSSIMSRQPWKSHFIFERRE